MSGSVPCGAAHAAPASMRQHVHALSCALCFTGAALSQGVLAAEPRAASGTLVAPSVGAGTAIPSLGVGGMFQALFGLAVVLAMVFGFAWLARRFGLQAPRQGNVVRVVGGTMLTQKERVMVVEVAGTWLVLGVAPGQVSMLHSLPAGSAQAGEAASAAAGSFSNRLRDSLGKRFAAGEPGQRR